jgi:hypothetical protein
VRARAGSARFAAALAALLLSGSDLSAQPMAGIFVSPGDRVRMTTRDRALTGGRRVGALRLLCRDRVAVDWTGGTRETLPLDRLAGLEVSDGSGGFVAHGTGCGVLAGAVVGGLVGAIGRRERWTSVRLEPPRRRRAAAQFPIW